MILHNIEAKCKQCGISIAALERAVGLGNATIKGWGESSPRVESIKKVADYFNCTIDELIKDSQQEG